MHLNRTPISLVEDACPKLVEGRGVHLLFVRSIKFCNVFEALDIFTGPEGFDEKTGGAACFVFHVNCEGRAMPTTSS